MKVRTAALLSFLLPAGMAAADGGLIRASDAVAGYRVSLFTEPTPLREGAADVSVLIQDAATRRLASDVSCTVRLHKARSSGDGKTTPATQDLATNKIFQAAHVEFTSPGEWEVVATVHGPLGQGELRCVVAVAPPTPRWVDLAGWIAAPFAILAAMGIQFFRRGFRRMRRPAAGQNGVRTL